MKGKNDPSALWLEYFKKKSPETRNPLIEFYLPIVTTVAHQVYLGLPKCVELDDIINVGVFGLMDAIKSFDFNRNVNFETYSTLRIRGAILDELRNMDWVPRLVRTRAHELEKTIKILQTEYGRTASDEEIAHFMGVSFDKFNKIKRDATAASLVPLNRKLFETESFKEIYGIDVLEDKKALNSALEAERKDFKRKLLQGFNRKEQLIIILYYYENMTMKEIGLTLDLSESRVSQMHNQIIQILKSRGIKLFE